MSSGLEGLPEHIGRYEVRGVLGRGGMGRVVAGYDPVLRRDVAIKVVEPAAVDLDDLAELRFLFHREARATAALRHPNIVEVFDYSGPDAELVYIACELIDGPTLDEVVHERGGLPIRAVAAMGYELTQALNEAHRHGIVHRDLKPENVFWTRAGRVVLGDFGIAKAFDGTDRLGGTIEFGGTSLYGSPSYMAPEQITEQAVGPHTDLYALGAILYECASGQMAYGGSNIPAILQRVVAGDHVALNELVSVPRRFAHLVESLLAVDASGRPASAVEVARDLRVVLDELQVSDPRLCLRDFGEATAAHVSGAARSDPHAPDAADADAHAHEDEDDRGIFEPPTTPEPSIRIPRSTSLWAGAAARGPVVLGMIAMAVALMAGVYLFGKLSAPIDAGGAFVRPEPTVSTRVDRPPAAEDQEDVFVYLRFTGRTTILIDGAEVGTWAENVRLALPPGRHTLEARSTSSVVRRDVLLLAGTNPEFDLDPPPP